MVVVGWGGAYPTVSADFVWGVAEIHAQGSGLVGEQLQANQNILQHIVKYDLCRLWNIICADCEIWFVPIVKYDLYRLWNSSLLRTYFWVSANNDNNSDNGDNGDNGEYGEPYQIIHHYVAPPTAAADEENQPELSFFVCISVCIFKFISICICVCIFDFICIWICVWMFLVLKWIYSSSLIGIYIFKCLCNSVKSYCQIPKKLWTTM